MGKKKAFIDKKQSQHFRLVPDTREKTEKFQPSEEHLAEQQKYGVFYDDDYDYMQHLRGVNEPMKLENINEVVEKVTVKTGLSPFPPAPLLFGAAKKSEFVDNDVAKVLDGEELNGNLDEIEDDFIALAGGAVDDRAMFYRNQRNEESDGEEEQDMFDDYDDDELFGDEDKIQTIKPNRDDQREIDDAFEQLVDREYNNEQIGELDGDDDEIGGCLEPADGRLRRLASEKGTFNPEYDEELAKQYVRERMRLIEEGVITEKEEMEIVEVDESCRKRMKWDCESFATQYTNIYNHPTLIREQRNGISRKALKKFDKAVENMDIAEENEEEEEDDEMEDDAMSQCTSVSTFRPKGETPEQRRLRKQAVKEARRVRRQEKKANKIAFAEESRKIAKGKIGQLKARPV